MHVQRNRSIMISQTAFSSLIKVISSTELASEYLECLAVRKICINLTSIDYALLMMPKKNIFDQNIYKIIHIMKSSIHS
jgi:hypothetical protein